MFQTSCHSAPLDLQEKLLRIDENKRGFSARRVTNIGKALGLAAFNELRDVSSKHLTPAFIAAKRRKRIEKEEKARQLEVRRRTQIALDEKLEAARIARRKTVQAQLNAQRRITQSAPTVKRVHALKDSHRSQELSRRLVDRNSRNNEQRKEMERSRAAEQAAEAKRLAAAEAKRRQEAAIYWSQQAKALREEVIAIKMKTTKSMAIEEAPIMPAGSRKKREELLNHPQSTTIYQRKGDAQSIGNEDVDNTFLPLFSTKQPFGGELIRAKIAEVEALLGNHKRKVSDLESALAQIIANEAALVTKQKALQSSIQAHEQKISDIVAGLKLPYPREPNEEQKAEMHCLESSISRAKYDIDSISNARCRLAERKEAMIQSIASLKRGAFFEGAECIRSKLWTLCPPSEGLPMVLGRGLNNCSNLGDSSNPSAILNDLIARSELELDRFSLPPSHSIAVQRRIDRREHDRATQQKEYIQNLITDRARKISSLSRQLTKKRREALNNEFVAFVAASKTLRKAPGAARTSRCDNDERCFASKADFDRRKLVRDGHDFVGSASRGLYLGDEHCIYDLNAPTGIHKMKLCQDISPGDGDSEVDTPMLEERFIQEQRRAAYGDNIDFVGRIQGFHKKLHCLEASQDELRQRYAKAIEIVHKRKLSLENKEGDKRSAIDLEEMESKAKEMKLALVNLSTEIKTKRRALKALERKYQRYQRLLLRRSVLTNNFFPRERHRILLDAFGRWRFYRGLSIGTREGVERKLGILMGYMRVG